MKIAMKVLAICALLTVSACGKDSDQAGGEKKDRDYERGKAVYVANCIACHNPDPAKEGSIGPALRGSPPELIESRVLRIEYPPNYKPKRATKVMPTFPFLKSEIPYLVAYLREQSAPPR